MITIGLVSWTSDARFIRAEFLRLRGQDFVQAAHAAGLPLRNILFRHLLPNGIAPVLVNASFGVATAILLESVLSFLGLGLEATDPSWGQLLNQARTGGTGFNWWIATFPGLAIFLTVFAYILIGEAMRDAIDPKLKKAGD
jgi:peptide/nickel transport system permease protein